MYVQAILCNRIQIGICACVCACMHVHAQAILYDKIQIAKAVNAKVISLDDAPKAYEVFDKGASAKYVIDPHGMTGQIGPV